MELVFRASTRTAAVVKRHLAAQLGSDLPASTTKRFNSDDVLQLERPYLCSATTRFVKGRQTPQPKIGQKNANIRRLQYM